MEDFNILDASEKKITYNRYGNFGERLVAVIIDGIIINIAKYLILFVIGDDGMAAANALGEDSGVMALMGGMTALFVGVFLTVTYYAYLESSEKQATFGKQAMGLVVTDLDGNRISFLNAVGRYFSKFLSTIILGIGYIMQAFDSKGQALHDKIAGTLVYKK